MINEKIAWLEENVDADAEELKAQKKEMEDVVQPIIAKLYQVLMTLFWEGFFLLHNVFRSRVKEVRLQVTRVVTKMRSSRMSSDQP